MPHVCHYGCCHKILLITEQRMRIMQGSALMTVHISTDMNS